MELYNAAIIQPEFKVANTMEDVWDNIKRYETLLDICGGSHRTDFPVRLVVFPEFFLQGFAAKFSFRHAGPEKEAYEYFLKNLVIDLPGEVFDRLGAKCKQYGFYLSGATFIRDPHWEDRYFNVAFIISPEGKVIHKYYKFQTPPIDVDISPHDMWDEWVRVYGDSLETLFPVTDTPIGKLATFICYDGCFPEIARAVAVQGAEVMLRPTGWPEPWMSREQRYWEVSNWARAMDNTAYVVAPNYGRNIHPSKMQYGCPGHSMIVDYTGRTLAMADYVGESMISAPINIDELREFRTKTIMMNFLPHIRSEIYAKIYEQPLYPKNRFVKRMIESPDQKMQNVREVIETLTKRGVFTRTSRGT